MKPILLLSFLLIVLGPLKAQPSWLNQAELESWGNLKGIRISGQLVPFETSLRLAYPGGPYFNHTEKEWQRPHFERSGHLRIVTTRLDSIYFKETVEDLSPGSVKITVSCRAAADIHLKDIEFSIKTPGLGIPGDALTLVDSGQTHPINLQQSTGFDLILHPGNIAKGDTLSRTFVLKATTHIDQTPAEIQLGPTLGTRAFEGMGGNFRIQNLRLDPSIIDYNLAHLRVAMARVECPWRDWQPGLGDKPLDSARLGKLAPNVKRALDLTGRLGAMHIPLVLTAWFPPDWAIIGPVRFQPGPDHIWGNALDSSRMQEIYTSLGDYIQCLKDLYKTEISYFSFNESNLGINVRMTGAEHQAFIKGFGQYLQSRGFSTRVLLGDNSDANSASFMKEALQDAATRPYIGAVSFHSWRGWETDTLSHWAKAADELGVPLIVGEGSIDAAAWSYPQILLEPSYALEEIGLYVKLLDVCQPTSILQWQLTSDYSLLTGLRPGDTLQPTQRFWNYKQLSSTPVGLYHIPVSSSRKEIGAAALGDKNGAFALHLVNLGPTRRVQITGIPVGIRHLKVLITSEDLSMKELKDLNVTSAGSTKSAGSTGSAGSTELTLPAGSFVSLMNAE
jgi:hypothetical protein